MRIDELLTRLLGAGNVDKAFAPFEQRVKEQKEHKEYMDKLQREAVIIQRQREEGENK